MQQRREKAKVGLLLAICKEECKECLRFRNISFRFSLFPFMFGMIDLVWEGYFVRIVCSSLRSVKTLFFFSLLLHFHLFILFITLFLFLFLFSIYIFLIVRPLLSFRIRNIVGYYLRLPFSLYFFLYLLISIYMIFSFSLSVRVSDIYRFFRS